MCVDLNLIMLTRFQNSNSSTHRYCLGTASGASQIEMMEAARHKSVENSKRYIEDAAALFATAKAEGYAQSQLIFLLNFDLLKYTETSNFYRSYQSGSRSSSKIINAFFGPVVLISSLPKSPCYTVPNRYCRDWEHVPQKRHSTQ